MGVSLLSLSALTLPLPLHLLSSAQLSGRAAVLLADIEYSIGKIKQYFHNDRVKKD